MKQYARTIPLNKSLLKKVSRIVSSLFQRDYDPVKDWYPYGSLRVEDLRGTEHEVSIVLEAMEGDKLIPGGELRWEGRKATELVIYFSHGFSFDTLEEDVYSILLHEVTHLRDPFKHWGGGYYNNPREVRAYLQQIVDEVEGLKGDVQQLLDKSKTWKRVNRFWSFENRKRVLKTVYTLSACS